MPSPGNLIHETSVSTGTGNFTLVAENGKQRFSEEWGTGGSDVFDYFISNRDAGEWEVGTGHLLDANTLVRDTVAESSNADAAVNFSAGTKDVTNDVGAAKIITTDEGLLGRTLILDADKDSTISAASDDQVVYSVGSTTTEVQTPALVSESVGWEAKAEVQLSGDITAQITGQVNDYEPTGLANASVLRLSSTQIGADVTGIAGGTDGRVLIIHNVGVNRIDFPSEDTGSLAANRFLFDAVERHVHGDACIALQYDGTSSRWRAISVQAEPQSFVIAASDEASDLIVGTAKVTFRMPYRFLIEEVRASVNEAPTGSGITVDINDDGSTLLSTKLTIDAGEKTSQTAAVPPVLLATEIIDDSEITIDIDAVGSTTPGKGLKVTIIGLPS